MTPEEKAVLEAALEWEADHREPGLAPDYESVFVLAVMVRAYRKSLEPQPRYFVVPAEKYDVRDHNLLGSATVVASCTRLADAERIAALLNESEK